MSDVSIEEHVDALPWGAVGQELDAEGWSILPQLLKSDECDDLARLYGSTDGFRSRVVMARHSFGRGEYRYFSYPLPALVQRLRASLYTRLVPIANRWNERLGEETRFPSTHRDTRSASSSTTQREPSTAHRPRRKERTPRLDSR